MGFITRPVRVRALLTANRTYYVRTDGSDSNTGIANTAAGAFLTVQKAIDTVAALDLATFAVTIQVADGTYTGATVLKDYVGVGPVTILGNATTPDNVIFSVTGDNAIYSGVHSRYALNGLKLQTTTSGVGLQLMDGAVVTFTNLVFGACAGAIGFYVGNGSVAVASGPVKFTASIAYAAFYVEKAASLEIAAKTITVTGTPAFGAFIRATRGAVVVCTNNTYVGTATGTQYVADTNSVIIKGADTYPGNAAGTTATGGQVA